ncbi:MAG UNVERIFIED_CONTAM: hypothetical protein LVR18_39460 [Planctomycetaceae bacterium]|jgi:hypothetical protein
MGPDLLLIEELLASQLLWLQSPDSLRGEAVSMVAAITQDLVAISGLRPAVLLCPAASRQPGTADAVASRSWPLPDGSRASRVDASA